jgi:hypothetical protein
MRTVITLVVSGLVLAGLASAGGPQPVRIDLKQEWSKKLTVLAKQIERRREIFGRMAEKEIYNAQATIHESDRTPVDVVLRRSEALLEDLAESLPAAEVAAYRKRIESLKKQAASLPAAKCDIQERRERQRRWISAKVLNAEALMPVFAEACRLNREISLRNPLLDFDRIVFVKRNPVKMSHMCDEWYGRVSEPGGGLYILEGAFSENPALTDLLAGTAVENGRLAGKTLEPGAYITPEVDYDAKRIYFAYSENDRSFNERYNEAESSWRFMHEEYFHETETAFHLFRINADGTGLTMLTDGENNDFYPAVLPNGRIAFLSERRGGEGRCHPRPCPTYVMHTMLPDGSDIVPISYHEINEWSPVVTNDGRIIYSRWDYVDRGFSKGQHPWISDPDGRDVRALYGNYEGGGGSVQADLRPVPASPLFFGTMYGHHSASWGTLTVYDSTKVDDGSRNCWKYLTPEIQGYNGKYHRGAFATPYPLSEKYFLCAYSPDAPLFTLNAPYATAPTPHGVYLVDCFGNKTLLYRGGPDDTPANMPYPLRPRKKPPVIPHATAIGLPPGMETVPVKRDPATAEVAVMDVYNSLLPWPEDRKIKALRIVQVLPKSTPGASSPPIAYDAEFVARQVLGTVPVEEDGSVHFIMPAGKPVFFQALDADGCAIQSMRSSAYAMPGETMTCLGCHEPKGKSVSLPAMGAVAALKREPSVIQPGPEGSKPFNFPRLVQPVLDAKCVKCHDKHAKAPDLKADGKISQLMSKHKPKGARAWTTSYVNLAPYAWCYNTRDYRGKSIWNSEENKMRSIPGQVGAKTSKLYKLLTEGSHTDKVKLTSEEMDRLVTWLDIMSPFFGAYRDTRAQKRGEAVEPKLE